MQNCTKCGFLAFFNAKTKAMLHKTMPFMQICIKEQAFLIDLYPCRGSRGNTILSRDRQPK